jgi:maltose O-acetyltransferase
MLTTMSDMKDRMLRGEPYRASDPEIQADQQRAAELVAAYNSTRPGNVAGREEILRELVGELGEGSVIRPPVQFDYGWQTAIGARTFLNFGAVILDVARVRIGDDVQIGPNVQLLTPTHPMDPAERADGLESAEPITIEDRVWLGGGVIVCPGVTVGAGSVVGAGAVVTRDVPPGVFAAGNPCRVVRELDAN